MILHYCFLVFATFRGRSVVVWAGHGAVTGHILTVAELRQLLRQLELDLGHAVAEVRVRSGHDLRLSEHAVVIFLSLTQQFNNLHIYIYSINE